ncbi:MAG: cobyric acid synthase [Lachnospiraceae bacterium]|nr:cobyric acid synthase [Lachnospiraceae bacterium]
MAKIIMVQGTMSGAGKSLLVAGLCRIFRQDGYRVAPFKSQNMALNSFVTTQGLEMGRAQAMQAEAAGILPSVLMNPVLLKPTNHMGSQVIVNGEVLGNMQAVDYFAYKKSLMPAILEAFRALEEQADIIVIEGAGSPAEINLRENDIVNMGLAEALDAPVLLVGDIDRGGVFAQLLGTLMLLEENEQERVKGLIVNKFRGDRTILEPGIRMLEERGGKRVLGVVPYMEVNLEDEDSLTERFHNKKDGVIQIAVLHYPRISNFTDVAVFERMAGVSVRYVTRPGELVSADMIVLPGSKNTMGDLRWLRENGFEEAICKAANTKVIIGICGGYQMLGERIWDPEGMEEGGEMDGLALLPVRTTLRNRKTRTQCTGRVLALGGPLSPLSGQTIAGYEIHMGETYRVEGDGGEWEGSAFSQLSTAQEQGSKEDGTCVGNVYGTYVHGVFDEGDIAHRIAWILAERKGVCLPERENNMSYRDYKDSQYDLLAKNLRESLDMEAIYGMLREAGGIVRGAN